MRVIAGFAVLAALAGPAQAIECPLTHALYEQPGRQVTLRFADVPRDAASNQIASFAVRIEGVDAAYEGGIHIPNGFGQPQGSIGQQCPEAGSEECRFWEGIVYALGADGIEEFPYDPDLTGDAYRAPQQVLLPGFASNVWYSMERGAAFEGERVVLDVFTLAACAK
jgi:hypothetical protein